MGRKWKICFSVIIVLFLWGCGRRPVETVRVVTQMDVVWNRDDTARRSTITDQAQIVQILNCLRLRQTLGPAQLDPERVAGDIYRIDIHLSDGTHKICYQRGMCYYSEDLRRWQRIGKADAQALQALLQEPKAI